MSSYKIPRWAIAALTAIPAFGAGLAVSAAASGTTPKVFYACLKGGTLSKVSNASAVCGTGHKKVVWDALGPQGPPGKTGPQGPGAQTAANAPLTLTAGDWIVTAETAHTGFGCTLTTGLGVYVVWSSFSSNNYHAAALVVIPSGGSSVQATDCNDPVLLTAIPTTQQT